MAESGSGRISVRLLSWFLLFLFYSIALANDATGENLRLRMETQIDPLVIDLLRGPAGQQVERFYTERAYKPAWSMGGRPTHQVDELRQVVAATFAHGLDPSDYHQEALDGFNNHLGAISATDERYNIQSGSLRFTARPRRIRLNTRYSASTQGTGAKSASCEKVFGAIA